MEGWTRRRGGRRSRRLLLHLDIDAFLASVAQLTEPGLIGRPVIVGSGVVASRSYEAKARGVETAMPIREALRRCPELVLRDGDAQVAARFRRRVGEIVGRFVPIIEMSSLDDMYADLTGVVFGGGATPEDFDLGQNERVFELAGEIRTAVRRETGLSISQGIAATRTLARLATTRAKPGGICWVRPGEERAFLDPLPVGEIPGIGRKTAEILRTYRIERVAELRLVGRALLRESFGRRGEEIYWKLRGLPAGEADRAVRGAEIHGSPGGTWGDGIGRQISRETSLWEPTADPGFLTAMLSYLVDRATHALREKRAMTRRLDVKLALADGGPGNGRSLGRRSPERIEAGRVLPAPSACRETLNSLAGELLERLLENRCLVSKIGVCLSRFSPMPTLRQGFLGFWNDPGLAVFRERNDPGLTVFRELRAERLDVALDHLREKHGFGAVVVGESVGLIGKLAHSCNGFRLRTPSLTL